MKKSLLTALTVFLALSTAPANADDLSSWAETYRQRYGLNNPLAKLTDNRGNGHENLYGTRNFRAVLHGVFYRGGANNLYHRSAPRANTNPLPDDGLENLCEEGFGLSVYLYSTNFNTAPRSKPCASLRADSAALIYRQINPLTPEGSRKILELVHETILTYRHGPIYAHCWNGWHASGYISALALMQFCGMEREQAVDYWNRATDGFNQGPSYDRVRAMIRAFTPYADLSIPESARAAICVAP